jgi:ABC-2 type transport system permease protein
MTNFLSLYKAFLRISTAMMIQYRASGLIWMIGAVLDPIIFLVVWSVAARASDGAVGGMTPSDFAAYYIVLMVINHLTFSWIMEVFQYRVQYGNFNAELLRPVHPIHMDIADNIAYKLVMTVVMIPAVGICIWLFEPHFVFIPWALAAALPAIFLAFLVRFFLEWTLALVTFWTTRTQAINRTYFGVLMFMSGRVAPIALLPSVLQDVTAVLPFYYMVAFPVELAVGRLSPAQALDGFLIQILWVGVTLGLITSTWRFALKRFSAVGG